MRSDISSSFVKGFADSSELFFSFSSPSKTLSRILDDTVRNKQIRINVHSLKKRKFYTCWLSYCAKLSSLGCIVLWTHQSLCCPEHLSFCCWSQGWQHMEMPSSTCFSSPECLGNQKLLGWSRSKGWIHPHCHHPPLVRVVQPEM